MALFTVTIEDSVTPSVESASTASAELLPAKWQFEEAPAKAKCGFTNMVTSGDGERHTRKVCIPSVSSFAEEPRTTMLALLKCHLAAKPFCTSMEILKDGKQFSLLATMISEGS